MGRIAGIPCEKTEIEHQRVRDLLSELIEKHKRMYETNGLTFESLPVSHYFAEITKQTNYKSETIRRILANGSDSTRTIRKLHKEQICLRYLKRTPAGI